MTSVLLALLLLTAQEIPRLTQRVEDRANVLSPSQENELTALLEELERKDSTQVVVLTVESTQPDSIEGFANRTFNSNEIGQKGKNNGALIVVAVKDRKVRIEVGYGLEEKLTDATCSLIIQREMVPHFKSGRYGDGIVQGCRGVVDTIRGTYSQKQSGKQPLYYLLLQVLFPLIFFIFIRSRFRGIRTGFRSPWGSYGTFSTFGRGGFGGGLSGGGRGFSGGGGSSGGGGASGGW